MRPSNRYREPLSISRIRETSGCRLVKKYLTLYDYYNVAGGAVTVRKRVWARCSRGERRAGDQAIPTERVSTAGSGLKLNPSEFARIDRADRSRTKRKSLTLRLANARWPRLTRTAQ